MVSKQLYTIALVLLEVFLSITLGSLTIIPGIIFLYVLNHITRFFISKLLWLIYSDEIILNPTGYDGMYMFKGHKNGKRMILYASIQENPIDIESHRQSYLNHVVNTSQYQKLKKIWTKRLGYFCLKEDTNFCIKNHVKIYKGLEDNNRVVTEEELMTTILPELSHDIEEETRPQWEDVIIPRFKYASDTSTNVGNSPIKSIRIFRIHHGYMDGLSTMLMLAYSQSEGRDFPWIINPLESPRRSVLSKLFFYSYCYMTFASHIFKNLLNPPSAIKNRWHVRRFTGNMIYSWSKPLSMSLLRQIKTASNASMPAVLCSILTSSLRKFEEKFDTKHPRYKGTMSEEIVIGLVAALLPYPDLELRNQHCILKCHLNSKEMTRTQRLREVNKEMIRLSKSSEIHLNFIIPRLFGGTPAWFSDLCTSLIAGCGVVSNFPAASRKVKLWGNEVNEMAGWVPLPTPAGFGCVTLRYANHLRFCMNADDAAMSKEQMDFLVDTITTEAELLLKEISAEITPLRTDKKRVNSNNNSNSDNNNNDSFLNDERVQKALDRVFSSVKKIKQG